MKFFRKFWIAAALTAILLTGVLSAQKTSAPAHTAAAKSADHPKLVVILVVDQMRADYVDHFRNQWTGGLARLVREGAWYRLAAYPYMTTVTCAGHATISTGAFPATHGMIANSWYERDEPGGGRNVTCTQDSSVKNIGYNGDTTGADSPARLRVATFSDALRAQAGGGTRVVAFSLKARAAETLAGHRADAVAWHDDQTGVWATSSYYGTSTFVADYTRAHPVSADYGKTWNMSLPASAYLYDDPTDGQHTRPGWTMGFPHPLRGLETSTGADHAFYVQWEESPFSDEYMEKMAVAAVDSFKLGQGNSTDFLAISFSALDHVGHDMGPHSHELQDVLVRLDRDVDDLLKHLDATVGRGNYVVAFSSDHGVAPIPEQSQRDGLGGGRVSAVSIRRHVNELAGKSIGEAAAIAAMNDGDIVFTAKAEEKFRAQPQALEAIVKEIESTPGVLRVFYPDQLDPMPQTPDPILRAASLSYVAGRSGDLVIALKPYYIFAETGTASAPAGGTSHGTANSYDQRVPLIFYGYGIRGGIYLDQASPADIAPTFAYLCNITLARVDGHVLTSSIAPQSPATPPHSH